MMSFDEIRKQLSAKICMGSQGNVLTEKVQSLMQEAYDFGRADAHVVLDPSAQLLTPDALKQIINENIESAKSNPAKKALRDLYTDVCMRMSDNAE